MRRSLCILVCVLMTLILVMGCAKKEKDLATNQGEGGKALQIKVGHAAPPTHPYQMGLDKFKEAVAQKTNGKVDIESFHSSQLGNEREMIEGLQLGTLDMALISSAPLSGFSSKFLVLDLPFIFSSSEQAYKVLDGEIGTEILSSLKEKGIIGLAFWENGFRNITNSKRPIIHPADLKGIKIRTMENPIHMASFSQVGADPTPMAFGELFTALQQKVVDGEENPIPLIWTSNFHEVQKYLSLTGHFYAASPLLMSKAVWDKLPADVQGKIKEAATEARGFEREQIQQMDTKLLEEIKKKGIEVSSVDKTEWIEAMAPVYKKFENEIGADLIAKVRSVK